MEIPQIIIVDKQFQDEEVSSTNRSTLWIYGDSISYYFYKRVEEEKICNGTFNKCGNTYNWIYPKILYEMVMRMIE